MDSVVPFQLLAVPGVRVLRLKSWSSQSPSDKPAKLGDQHLPTKVGTVEFGATRILCLGPSEWLLVVRGQIEPDPIASLQSLAADRSMDVIDMTDGLTVLELRGWAISRVLEKGCGLDLNSEVFRAGQCTRTRLAQILVALERPAEPHRFVLYAARSYIPYLNSWLINASLEFGETTP